jgi:hypothetical protein
LANDGFWKTLAESVGTIGQALVKKDLKHPSNWNLFFDFLMILVIIVVILSNSFSDVSGVPLAACVITALVFIFLCFLWTCYCHEKSKH